MMSDSKTCPNPRSSPHRRDHPHHLGLRGGPAPVRRFLPSLIELVLDGRINPGKVFDLRLPFEQVAEAYRAIG